MNSFCCITTTIFLAIIAATLAGNCYGPANKLNVVELDVFPSPVAPGDTVYARANLWPSSEINSASVTISVYHTDNADVSKLEPIVNIVGLDFCTLSSYVTCPLKANSTVLSWDFLVPDVPPGTYQVIYAITEHNPADGNPYSCVQFEVTIAGAQTSTLKSEYQVVLLGSAVFATADYTKRQIGDLVQVGPAGPLSIANSPYGELTRLKGTGDLVPYPLYDTTKFVWGLNGTLDTASYGPNNLIKYTYKGSCFLGYIGGGYNYDYNNPLLEGTFTLTWTYSDSSTGQISGTATFEPASTVPVGWGYPLLYGRIGTHQVQTSNYGFLMVSGSVSVCSGGGLCQVPVPGGSGGGGLPSDKLGLAVGLPIAAVFILVLVGAALLYWKRRRETEQEDGIFAVARKPEYGSALVVDDIIEETRGSKTMQAMIDIKDEYSEGESDNDESDRSRSDRGRSRSRTPASRSVSRSRSLSGARSGNDSDPGESASRDSDSD